MKLRPLHQIDLAGTATLPRDEQFHKLRVYEEEGPRPPYTPARNAVFDTFHPPTPLGLVFAAPTWVQLDSSIRRDCKFGPKQIASNLEVGKLLFDWVRARDIKSVAEPLPSLGLGQIATVRYWENLIFELEGQRYIPAFNHRRNIGYGPDGRRFIFSAMNVLRMRNLDFSNYRLAIFEFPVRTPAKSTGRKPYRELVMRTDLGLELFSLDEMDAMVKETYEILDLVRLERIAAGLKRA